MITVEKRDNDILVRIPSGEISMEAVNSVVDDLRFELAAEKSRMTEPQAEEIAERLKAAWWAANKTRFIQADQ